MGLNSSTDPKHPSTRQGVNMADANESKILESAFDSPTFGEDGSFRLDKPVGSASISPCGRDVVLAS